MAIIFSGVGFLLAIVPPTSGIAWLVLLTGTILGIVALARRAANKLLSIAAIVVGVIGWIISIIVFFVSATIGLSNAINDANDAPSVSQADGSTTEDESEQPADELAAIGDTVTSGEGVSFTVNSVTCGLAKAGESFTEETAKGEFCEIQLVVANGTEEAINVFGQDFTAYIGDAKYETSSLANTFGDNYFSSDVNPGLSTTATVYFDIPAGSALETVQYLGLFSLDDALVVKVS